MFLFLTHTAAQSHILKPEEVTISDAIICKTLVSGRFWGQLRRMKETKTHGRRAGEGKLLPNQIKVYQSRQNSQSASSMSTGHFLFRLIYTLTCYMSHHRCENQINYQHNHKHHTVCNKSIDCTSQTQVCLCFTILICLYIYRKCNLNECIQIGSFMH